MIECLINLVVVAVDFEEDGQAIHRYRPLEELVDDIDRYHICSIFADERKEEQGDKNSPLVFYCSCFFRMLACS